MAKGTRSAERIKAIEGLSLFENCSRKDLGQIATIMTEAEKPAGTYLTREGHDGGLMFVLLDGAADVIATGPDGAERIIGRIAPGDVVGELSLIDGHARSASVRATSPVRVLQLAADDFRTLIHGSPQFVKNLLRSLSIRVREADELSG